MTTILNQCQNQWILTASKLSEIQHNIDSFTIDTISRKDRMLIRSLSIGHTNITHQHSIAAQQRPIV